ncbi:MAG: hypothetical protein AAGD96_11825, partial [Chloroflexota bacterium]
VGYILSEEFAVLLSERPEEEQSSSTEEPGTEEEVEISDSEVQTWMNAFEKAPHRAPDVHIVKLPPKPTNLETTNESRQAKSKKQKAKVNLDQLKNGEGGLSEQDLQEWIHLFDDEKIRQEKDNSQPVVIPDPAAKQKKKTKRKKGEPVVRKYADGGLNEEEINSWLDFFQENKRKSDK